MRKFLFFVALFLVFLFTNSFGYSFENEHKSKYSTYTCKTGNGKLVSSKEGIDTYVKHLRMAEEANSYKLDSKLKNYVVAADCLEKAITLSKDEQKADLYYGLIVLYNQILNLVEKNESESLYYSYKSIYHSRNAPSLLQSDSADFNVYMIRHYIIYTSTLLNKQGYESENFKQYYKELLVYFSNLAKLDKMDTEMYFVLANYHFRLALLENSHKERIKHLGVAFDIFTTIKQQQDNLTLNILIAKIYIELYKISQYQEFTKAQIELFKTKNFLTAAEKELNKLKEIEQDKTAVDYNLTEVYLRSLKFKKALVKLKENSINFTITDINKRIWLSLAKQDKNLERRESLTTLIKALDVSKPSIYY